MERAAKSDHLQQTFLTCEQTLGALEVIDVGLQHVPLYDFAFAIPQRLTVDSEPAIDAVRSKQAMLAQHPLAGLERMLLAGDHRGNVVGMHKLRGRPALDLFECGAEVIEDRPVDPFDRAVRRDDADQGGNAIGYEQVIRANGGNILDRRNCEILCHRDSLMTAAFTQHAPTSRGCPLILRYWPCLRHAPHEGGISTDVWIV